ncbi:MAG: hypothetical protein KatS3mg131_2578 [Candidatus Tectimicrobiota bacterium]|nr:MAG: hypothetical protein KatS3mg131_2578 [Candidatus Tectomicrobia bacterium]
MKRYAILLLSGTLLGSLAAGCTNELQALRADLTALQRQQAQQDSAVKAQLDSLEQRVSRLMETEAQTRQQLARMVATSDELRLELQRLRGSVQELEHRLQRRGGIGTDLGDTLATKLAEVETRLRELEARLRPEEAPPAPKPPAAAPAARPAPAPTPPPAAPAAPAPAPPPAAPAATPAVERLYERAMREYQQGNYEVAIVLWKQLLREFPQSPLAGNAQYWIGESLYAQGQYEAAIVAFDEVIQKYPKDNKVPAALLKQGMAFAALKDLRNARFFLQQVQKQYPDTPEARQAAELLKKLGS